jgi:hypothetical protein
MLGMGSVTSNAALRGGVQRVRRRRHYPNYRTLQRKSGTAEKGHKPTFALRQER